MKNIDKMQDIVGNEYDMDEGYKEEVAKGGDTSTREDSNDKNPEPKSGNPTPSGKPEPSGKPDPSGNPTPSGKPAPSGSNPTPSGKPAPSESKLEPQEIKVEEIAQEEKVTLSEKIKRILKNIFEKLFKRNNVRKLSRRDIAAINEAAQNEATQEPTFAQKRENFRNSFLKKDIDNQTAIDDASKKSKEQTKSELEEALRKQIKSTKYT